LRVWSERKNHAIYFVREFSTQFFRFLFFVLALRIGTHVGNATLFFFEEDGAMFGILFRPRKEKRPERPTVRLTLESLERRDVLSPADVSVAFDALPTAMNNLEASLAPRPTDFNTVQSNINTVSKDIVTLILGASDFTVPSRLQIDNALVVNGLRLVFDGFNTFPAIPSSQFVQIERLGSLAVERGAIDFLIAGFFPQTSGDAVLT
jgi:hypothetical protein